MEIYFEESGPNFWTVILWLFFVAMRCLNYCYGRENLFKDIPRKKNLFFCYLTITTENTRKCLRKYLIDLICLGHVNKPPHKQRYQMFMVHFNSYQNKTSLVVLFRQVLKFLACVSTKINGCFKCKLFFTSYAFNE